MEHKKFLYDAAEGAGKILLKHFGKIKNIEKKIGAGIVTEADKNAESHILSKIFRNFKDSSIITEESGEFKGDPGLMWIIDPLDGTSNYAHGFPWFSVSIGLYKNGKPHSGVVYHPILKEMFYAEKGKGAFLNDKRIHVSKEKSLEDALVGTGFYYSKAKALQEEMKIFSQLNEKCLGVRRPGSAALDLAQVASGRYDAFWEKGLSPWDVAAGFLLVEEAGGKITGYEGQRVSIFDKQVVASNGRLHDKMVDAIQCRKKQKKNG